MYSVSNQKNAIALKSAVLNGRILLEARLEADEVLEGVLGPVIRCASVADDRKDCVITEQRPTQLVPGALVTKSPSTHCYTGGVRSQGKSCDDRARTKSNRGIHCESVVID